MNASYASRPAGRVCPRLRGSVPPGPGSAAPAASLTRSLTPGGGASSQRTSTWNHVAVELTDADLQDTPADVGDIHRCQATAPRLRDPAQDNGVAFGAAREKGERATHELEDFLDVLIVGHWRAPSPAIPV